MQSITRLSKKSQSKSSKILPSTHPSLQSAIKFDAHKSISKKIARVLNMSHGRLLSYLACPGDQPFKFSARHLLPLMREAQSFETLKYLAANTGHAVIKIPDKKPNPERLVPVILDFSDSREELEKALNFYLQTRDYDSLKEIQGITWKMINICAEMRVIAEKLDYQLRGKA